jgi:outer membrane protein OmpA-like peptidoglycan-associated protein
VELTWIDLAYSLFYSVPGTRLADFSDRNMGGEVRFNFMILGIKPLWLHTYIMVNAHKTNSIRLDSIVDFNFGIGGGWRFPIYDRLYFTPKYSMGFMLHYAYGDYYNDPDIYPDDPRAGTKKQYYFSDSFMHIEAEIAYDISPESRKIESEVFWSPSFIWYPEQHRPGLEFGFLLGVRMKFDFETKRVEKKEEVLIDKSLSEKEEPIWGLFGNVFDRDSKQAVKGLEVFLTRDSLDNDSAEVIKELTNENGDFRIQLGKDIKYNVLLKKRGFFNYTTQFSTEGIAPGWYDLRKYMRTEVQKVKIGAIMEFGEINFTSGSAEISPKGKEALDRIIAFLNINANIVVELGAHTDSNGSSASNSELSEKRAISSVNYLISKGIAKQRITPKGYGETRLKNKCSDGVSCTPEEHKVNRRVELVVKQILSAEELKEKVNIKYLIEEYSE